MLVIKWSLVAIGVFLIFEKLAKKYKMKKLEKEILTKD